MLYVQRAHSGHAWPLNRGCTFRTPGWMSPVMARHPHLGRSSFRAEARPWILYPTRTCMWGWVAQDHSHARERSERGLSEWHRAKKFGGQSCLSCARNAKFYFSAIMGWGMECMYVQVRVRACVCLCVFLLRASRFLRWRAICDRHSSKRPFELTATRLFHHSNILRTSLQHTAYITSAYLVCVECSAGPIVLHFWIPRTSMQHISPIAATRACHHCNIQRTPVHHCNVLLKSKQYTTYWFSNIGKDADKIHTCNYPRNAYVNIHTHARTPTYKYMLFWGAAFQIHAYMQRTYISMAGWGAVLH